MPTPRDTIPTGTAAEPAIPFLDLAVSDPAERERLLAAIERVLIHGRLVNGPEVEAFEQEIARRCQRRHAIGVGSGTDALYLALRALAIGPDDEVITTPLSWVATANAIRLVGATPVFGDVDDELELDPRRVAALVTPRTRAILVVHFNGRMAPLGALRELAARHRIDLIEDAAQAFGAVSADGYRAGGHGRLACFSMNPMKVLAACGEAGVVVTDEPQLADRLRALRYNGVEAGELCTEPGLNGRLDTVQAALLLERLQHHDRDQARRRALAQRYHDGLEGLPGLLALPRERAGEVHAYYTYTVRVRERDRVLEELARRGIEAKVRHPRLIPDQPAYRHGARGHWPRASRRVEEILSLPLYPALTGQQVDRVCAALAKILGTLEAEANDPGGPQRAERSHG